MRVMLTQGCSKTLHFTGKAETHIREDLLCS